MTNDTAHCSLLLVLILAGLAGCKPAVSSHQDDQEEQRELEEIRQKAAPYMESYRQRLQAQEELAVILRRVRDPLSMKMAQLELKEKNQRFEELKNKARALPEPDPDVLAYLQARFEVSMHQAQARTRQEIQRISHLPGGPEILNNLNWQP